MKRIIALITAFCFIIWTVLFSVGLSVSAADDDAMTRAEYQAAQLQLLGWLKDGKINYGSYLEQSNSVTQRYYDENTDPLTGGILSSAADIGHTFEGLGVTIGNTFDKYGDMAKDYISDWISDFMDDYKVLNEVPVSDIDMRGYGAVAYVRQYNDELHTSLGYQGYYYCDYIILYPEDNYFGCYNNDNSRILLHDGWNGTLSDRYFDQGWCAHILPASEYQVPTKFYGDVRYADGEQAPTDDEYTYDTDYNFTHVSDKELNDLVDKIVDALENNNPDLTSIEGLLMAIYYRLGTLDKDDDNSLLSSILSALESLEFDGISEKSDISKLLKEIKEFISNEKEQEEVKRLRKELLKFLCPGEDEVSASKELMIKVKGLFYTKFSFIDEFKKFFLNISWSSPESISFDLNFNDNIYTVDTSVFNSIMPVIRGMLAFFTYAMFAVRSFKRMPEIISGGGDE